LIDAKIPMEGIICSLDGVNPDTLISGEAKILNKLKLPNGEVLPNLDIKQPDTWVDGGYNPHDINGNLKDSMKELAEVFKN